MWVFCCGMQRSGSTLQYQLTAEIVESLGIGKRLGFVDQTTFNQFNGTEDNKKGFLVVKCHGYFPEAGALIRTGEAKAVYVFRDVRDVVVSFMNFTGKSFEISLMRGYLESLLNAYYQWTRSEAILISKYEEMVNDIQQEVLRISDSLGIDIEERLAKKIADNFSIDQQKERIQQIDYENIYKKFGRRDAPDPYTMLKKGHINSGKTEQWKEVLTWSQIAMVESIACDWLVKRGYEINQGKSHHQIAKTAYLVLFKTTQFLIKALRFR